MWFDHRRIATTSLIDPQQPLRTLDRHFARIDPARLDIEKLQQLFIRDDIIALDVDAVDNRVLGNRDPQNTVNHLQADILKQVGIKQPRNRRVHRTCCHQITDTKRQIGQDSASGNPFVSSYFNGFNTLIVCRGLGCNRQ